jgi:hypothetical protein
MHQLNRRFVVLFSLVAGAGCGAAQMNETQQRRVSYSLHAAELEGASQHRRPARLLELARLELMKADRAADNGDERNATLLFERAEADAELARQLTRTLEEQQKAGIAWSELGRTEPSGLDPDSDQEEEDQEQRSPGGTL